VRVTDNGFPNLSDAKTFTVNVVSRPLLESISISNAAVHLTWSSITGTTYRVQIMSTLADSNWLALPDDVLAIGPTATATDTNLNTTRLYRVQVLP